LTHVIVVTLDDCAECVCEYCLQGLESP